MAHRILTAPGLVRTLFTSNCGGIRMNPGTEHIPQLRLVLFDRLELGRRVLINNKDDDAKPPIAYFMQNSAVRRGPRGKPAPDEFGGCR
jgi:hypothetical protein